MRWGAAALLAAVACSGPRPLATLTDRQGRVERDTAAQPGAWLPAQPGDGFRLGDGVVTRAQASARLALDDGSRLALEAGTLVRFADTLPPARGHAFDVETGAATLHAGEEPVALRMRLGLARIEGGSTVVLTPAGPRLRFEVRVGRAVFGDAEALPAGSRVLLDPSGGVQPEPFDSARDALARASLELADPTGAITAVVRGPGGAVKTGAGWQPLAEGAARLAAGSEVETGAETSIEIERGGQHARLEANGLYRLGSSDGVLVNAARGRVLAGGGEALRIEVPGGVIVIPAQGRVAIVVGAQRTALDVQAREALIDTGERQQLVATGESATLGRGGDLRLDPAEPPEPDPAARDEALAFADLELEGGASATIHDPVPPSAVRFMFGAACAGRGSVEVWHGARSLRRGVGEGSVALAIPPGTHRYELRCEGERRAARRGQLTVLADAATRSIAARPPSSAVAADGRKYTVLYQNRLPAVSVSWPNAPALTTLRLVHEFGGRRETSTLLVPRREFASGELAEGRHVFFFEGGGQLSRQTSVDIVFDNAAPRASLSLPPVLDARPGEVVSVAGTALPGSRVWVDGEPAALDARGRFSARATLPRERQALVIRLLQPGRGTHYYLRRGQSR